ncbi:hypothetical protein B0O99DRAFT_680535 [Bisporella sp. PMI_857]|nr:hypothetical protein B0O99DRAFT_680535 [Bisporella sp. PMI_857]
METAALAAESSIDKSPTKDDALKNAILATELYMKAVRLASSDQERTRLRNKCKDLLSRAEQIKKAAIWPPAKFLGAVLQAPVSERAVTRTEEIILLEDSKLHGFKFPPWRSDPEDELFDGELYTEENDLELSEAQREIFTGWKRPSDIFGRHDDSQNGADSKITMSALNKIDLVQDITTDCSVVASLCAVVARALKGHGKLLASIIYPFDRSSLRPRLSPNGKYIFRLNFNGCFRRVIIDDRLPVSSSSRSLHVIDRQNPKLLWPALIEKAYLKVRGGYDFPGSNSGTDLWVMTGWIPEQEFLQSDELQPEHLWHRVFRSFGFGDAMITLGTGKLSRKEERELGLAGEHDYAVLDMKEVGLQRLLLIKNPWCDGMVWKGARIATEDTAPQDWAGELHQALPSTDFTSPGTFWMNFEAVVQNFESLYLNWNPGLFTKRQDHHFSWKIPTITTPGSFTYNPQYAVNSLSKGTVWVLLSRHFANGELEIAKQRSKAFAGTSSSLGFISLYVFEANGQRVHLSDDAIHRGAFVDSPQTLARLELSPATPLTIVVAHHDLPLPKYSFTLSFFSRSSLTVSPAVDALLHCTTHLGSWTSRTAGGNASAASYPLNPQFSISIPSNTDISLLLETDASDLAVHVKMVWGNGERITTVTSKDILGGSGDYRRGCALASLRNVQPGKYTIVCSTFEPGQLGSFTLRIGSSIPCVVRPVPSESAGRLSLQLPRLTFHAPTDRMLAPISANRLTKLRFVARSPPPSRTMLKISIERGQGPNKTILAVSGTPNAEFSDAPMGIRTPDLDIGPDTGRNGGLWLVLERLGGRNGPDEADVEVLSEAPVSIGVWGSGTG